VHVVGFIIRRSVTGFLSWRLRFNPRVDQVLRVIHMKVEVVEFAWITLC